MLSFVLCDDNELILNKISKMLEIIFQKNKFGAKIALLSTSPQEVLDFMKNNTVNVLFLDIDLKNTMTGLELAEKIRENNKEIYIIFTTAHLEYILMAYKYKTFDFLPKPITIERLEETLLRLYDDLDYIKNEPSFIRISNNNTIINEHSVFFIKRDGMKVIFIAENRDYEIYSSFKKIMPALPKNFVRCHKSFIVNINRIEKFSEHDNAIFFDKPLAEKCYVGPKYKNNFMEVFNNYGIFSNNLDSFNYT